MLSSLRRGFSTLASIKQFGVNQIPQNLIVDRGYKQTTLPNGIIVCSEYWPSPLSHFTIFIRCGSRNETEETSGTAHFLEHLHFKGTGKRKRANLETDVENMGGQLNAYTARENTSYTLNFFNKNLNDAVEIIGDMLQNSLYSNSAVESERDTIYRELMETRKMQFETTIEVSHRGAYRNHQMQLPILGKISNMYSITRDMIVNYKQANYFGQNLIIAAGGGVNHEQLCETIQNQFHALPSTPTIQPNQPGRPPFQNEVFLMKSELTENLNIGLFYEAPQWNSPYYFHFLILQRLLADRPENQMEAEIFFSNEWLIFILLDSNLNTFQKQLLSCENIINQKAVYTPYKDTGLFGNYFMATPEKGIDEAIQLTQTILKQYAEKISEEELQRAKRRLFIELCQHETGNDLTQAIANQILYFERRLHRQEIAQSIAALSSEDISAAVKKWLVNKVLLLFNIKFQQYSLTLWGNIDNIVEKYGASRVGTH